MPHRNRIFAPPDFSSTSMRSHYIDSSTTQTIRDGNERSPLLSKFEDHEAAGSRGGGIEGASPVYSNLDTLTLSLVPNIKPEDLKNRGISWLSVAFGLANAAIGVGVLNFPAAYHKIGGIETATIVQLVLVPILFISMSILIHCSDLNQSTSYHELISNICGKKAELVVAVNILLTTFGISVSYLIVIGDQYDRVFASLIGEDFCKSWFLDRRFTITVTAPVMCPLIFMKRLDFLRHTGPLGIVSMIYVVFLTIYQHFALTDVKPGPMRSQPESFTSLLAVIPVMCFGYQCNEVIIPIYASMKDRKPSNFYKAASLAYGGMLFLYGAVGYFGYTTFGGFVQEDIITMFNARDPLVLIGIIALILKMAVTYPQMSFVGRGSFEGLYAHFCHKTEKQLADGESFRRTVISSIWFAAILALALFAPGIGVVIEALGSLAAVNIFIFPSLGLISLARQDCFVQSRSVRALFLIVASIFILIGVTVLLLVLYQVYLDISLGSESHQELCRL